MNKNYEAKLGMFRTVSNFNITNATAITATGRVVWSAYQTELLALIEAIEDLEAATEVATAPITADKAAARENLDVALAALAQAAYAYALDNNDSGLATEMKPLSVISNIRAYKDEIIIGVADNIIATVTPLAVADLEDYGVETATVTAATALKNAYEALVADPETAIEARKALNIQMDVAFNETAVLLFNKMDAIVDSIKYEYTVLYTGYYAARKIIGPMVMHTKIKGLITDAVTALPIQGVRVRMIPTPIEGQVPPAEQVIVYTDEFGNYTGYTPKFKNVPYTVIWTKTGYLEVQQTDIFVKLGKQTVINIAMETTP